MDRARANRRISRLLIPVIVLATASACSNEFERQFAEAEQLRAAAAAAGSEWLETGKLLEQARGEAARDNLEAAQALVGKARFQAEAAIKQAEHEAEAWTGRVVR